jgi:pimeloyl-ACP methyl ester carboxylesterase
MKLGWRAVALGGVEQWISVHGEDPSAPVLLFLHGGPGASIYGPRRKYLRRLERRWRVVDYPKAMRRSIRCLWADLGRRIDLVRDVKHLDVPVVLFAGRRDHITDLSLIELWHGALDAPEKRLEIVDDAGHLAPFEAPEAFMACLEALR